ncbi:MAG: hypothetical protein KTR26_18110 [Flammeovirgaceae bacterium]|nr:hypothetical protein [Flammeovirgaceae bacterium]
MVILINALANILPINNKTTGALSDQYPNLFVPAGITFSIWGVIYFLLLGSVIFQLFYVFKSDKEDGFVSKIGIWFLVSCLSNSLWILAWHYEKVALSLAIMLVLLFTLIQIYERLKIGLDFSTSLGGNLWIKIPFSIYLGWISIATIANVTALLVENNLSELGLSQSIWTQILIVIGILLALTILFKRKDIFYGLVVVWTYYGIYLKQANTAFEGIVKVAILGIILISIGVFIQIFRKRTYIFQ